MIWAHENETPRQRYARFREAFEGHRPTERQMDANATLRKWDDWYEDRDLGRPYETKREPERRPTQ